MLSENKNDGLSVTIHQPEHLPWLGFIDKLRRCNVFVLLDSVQFEKNYFQNRNRIRTAWGSTWLTVPVFTKGLSDQTISAVGIRNDEPWQRKTIQALSQHYRRSPYMDLYFPGLKEVIERRWDLLAELNIALIGYLAESFGISRRVLRSSELEVSGKRSELLVNICKKVGAKTYISGISGLDYLEESLFAEARIDVAYQDFRHPEYQQCYHPFLPQMSSVDMLFNEGPDSLRILSESDVEMNTP